MNNITGNDATSQSPDINVLAGEVLSGLKLVNKVRNFVNKQRKDAYTFDEVAILICEYLEASPPYIQEGEGDKTQDWIDVFRDIKEGWTVLELKEKYKLSKRPQEGEGDHSIEKHLKRIKEIQAELSANNKKK